MFKLLAPEIRRKLWPHHPGLLDFAIHHLNRYDTACLLRMPTGTGKTGIIACLTGISNEGRSLVLTPWANLRGQMAEELQSGFWRKTGIPSPKRGVVEMLPRNARNVLNSDSAQVIVATFTTLNDLRREDRATYDQLAKIVTLVIADECHYEPAVEWGQSVKGLHVRTLLLTATPYRNDLKLFRIRDPAQSTRHLTHEAAVQQGVIRELTFESLHSEGVRALCDEFVRFWRRAKSDHSLAPTAPRAIVCCSGAPQIETVVHRLREAGLQAIGVHEQFEGSKKEHLRQEVPKPSEEKADIWVHQRKLMEGLDDSRFCCLALLTRIRNDRRLIQQLGRILRRGSGDRDRDAVVLAPADYPVKESWDAYREFETQLELPNPEHFRKVVQALLQSQPDVEYFEGRFRKRFVPMDLQKRPQVIIPPSVRVRTVSKDFSLDVYVDQFTDTLNTEDAVILGPDPNAPCLRKSQWALWVYASVRNSRLLQNTSLYEIKLETHCVVLAEGYVLIADSRGLLPEGYLEDQTSSVAQERLGRYLDRSFRATHVAVDSSIPYDTVLRGGELRGHDLLKIATSLTDRIQICRSARGASKQHGRRYVGMTNARLRKEETAEERRTFEPEVFAEWARGVAQILNSRASPSKLFQRYLSACEPPPNPIPKTICIDLLREDAGLVLSDGRACRLKMSASDVRAVPAKNAPIHTCRFEIDTTGPKEDPLTLQVSYQATKRRFWFKKHEGPSIHVERSDAGGAEPKTFAEFLNQNQDVVLIGLDGGDIVYQDRQFYRVDYRYAEEALVGLIQRPASAVRYGTEKGTGDEIKALKAAAGQRFPEGSLFRAIAEQAIAFPFADELLICADLGTECADFVAASFSKQHLALIHVKAGTGTGISASAFHDVVAQAMKNLVYLTRNAEKPKGTGSWRPDSVWNKTGIRRIVRAPQGIPSQEALWNKIKSEILGVSNPQLYVILVTTGCCDATELKDAIRNPSQRTPETAQLVHLLDGLSSYSRQLGVQLVIYDLPYQAA